MRREIRFLPYRGPREHISILIGILVIATRECQMSIDCELFNRINLILPDGQITDFPVQPRLQKYFRIRLTRIKSISVTVSSHRGAIARRHERGAGCGGRNSVRRNRWSQGEMNLVSD